ncbi:nucleoside triphosphate pyrophosphohydrolase [Aciduricibacillus chroicocephali]|uniref:Nucleoside triphosphate pyrophosphohydrolase n=1 Tax=Aciduricibacillus chroicocephali TaxID=3054939 RepID=A0ABY9KV85_9BACI|nr:nucleoside triphosphate pyrophosphohydrolase [Bacillaceae bacterium 44XB]
MSFKIQIAGLGAGDIEQLPLGIYRKLLNHDGIIQARTLDHPVIETLMEEGVTFASFDDYYEEEAGFERVYERIAAKLLEMAQTENVFYVVPGHPSLAEMSVKLLQEQKEVPVEIIGGQSYLDDLFASLQIDPIEGFQFVDATSFQRNELNYRNHLVFCQVYDQMSASNVKLELLEDLPADYEIILIEAAGTDKERKEQIPLEDLDRVTSISNLTSVYIPPVPEELLTHEFASLRSVVRILRSPDGCPWDKEQTHESLRRYLIEEAYELIDAIEEEDDEGIIEEMGDVLLQIMMHAQIGEDDGYFTIDDVIRGITEKMINRHPHVFGDVHVESTEDVNANWEKIKKQEKQERDSILDGIPRSLPALMRSTKLQKKARKAGFQWESAEEIWEKFNEEVQEFHEALESGNKREMEEEYGDILFILVNLAIFHKIEAEQSLTYANEKFISRFHHIEHSLKKSGKELEDASLEEMDALWDEAKRKERE